MFYWMSRNFLVFSKNKQMDLSQSCLRITYWGSQMTLFRILVRN